MNVPEVEQLRILAQVDNLVDRLTRWADTDSAWEPANRNRALVRRLLTRTEAVRIRLESPLVVATFGGTGTGKSSLVNALVGQTVTRSGRERPTTTRPILILHPDTRREALGLPLDDFEIQAIDAAILRDIVIIDCPDPDTSESDAAETNLGRLRKLIPVCDVLLYASTQQKYRSARVVHELGDLSTGCRLIFVQTHAQVDSDIREDWRQQLEGRYEVPEMFFVDSVRAFNEIQAGKRPAGDFARLQDVLTTQLGRTQRIRIRRANLIDLICAAVGESRNDLQREQPAVDELHEVLQQQQRELTQHLASQLSRELLVSRNLWERRLLSAVTDCWGFSPFSSVLRFYNGLGGFIASLTLFRARSSAQMALIGAVQGTRWLRGRTEAAEADRSVDRVGSFGLDDATLRESRIVLTGYLNAAHIDPAGADQASMDTLRGRAAHVEGEFLGDARRRIDELIEQLAVHNSGWFTRGRYETLFALYVVFVLYRVGRNFFYDSFLRSWFQPGLEPADLMSVDFFVPAGLFFVLWSGGLVMAFTRRLRRGLTSRINQLATELASGRVSQGMFPDLEQICRQIRADCERLDAIAVSADEIRRTIESSSITLGGAIKSSTGRTEVKTG